MTIFFSRLNNLSSVSIILITTFSVISLEYAGAWFCDKILKEKLWDYSDMKYNLHGYISLTHSFYWLILVALFFFISYPHINNLWPSLTSFQSGFSSYDVPFTIIFSVATFSLTVHTRKNRIEASSIKHNGVEEKNF